MRDSVIHNQIYIVSINSSYYRQRTAVNQYMDVVNLLITIDINQDKMNRMDNNADVRP